MGHVTPLAAPGSLPNQTDSSGRPGRCAGSLVSRRVQLVLLIQRKLLGGRENDGAGGERRDLAGVSAAFIWPLCQTLMSFIAA